MISEEDTDKYLAEVLEILKEIFKGGRKWALLDAIYYCCLLKRPLPEWLRLAFLAAYHSKTGYKIESWDDAFGRPHPKSTHVDTKRRHFELRYEIMQRVEQVEKLRSEKIPVNTELFEKIGKDLGIGGATTVSDIYYKERRRLKEITDRLDEIRDQLLGTSEKK
jgi:hypothetical protein